MENQGAEQPKKEHHMAKAARERREAEERGDNIDKVTPTVHSKPTKNKRIIRAFEQEWYHYVSPRIIERNTIQDTRGRRSTPLQSIQAIDTINHPETGRPCIIRYIEGEDTIFKDRQSRDATDAKAKNILLKDGYISVNRSQTTLKEFMDLCNWNGTNKNRMKGKAVYFNLFDGVKMATEFLDTEAEIATAIVYFTEQSKSEEGIENLLAYAQTLMINIDREWSMIRADLMVFLKIDPRSFLDGLKNPSMKRKYIIMEALKNGVLSKDTVTGAISWRNGSIIKVPPIGKDAVDYFVQWTGDEGKNTYDHIKEETEKMLLERA